MIAALICICLNTAYAASADNAGLEKQAISDNSNDNGLLNTALDNSDETASREVRLSSTINANELSSVNSENKTLSASSNSNALSSSSTSTKTAASPTSAKSTTSSTTAKSSTSTTSANSNYIKASSIIKASATFIKYVETNGKLPSTIAVNKKNYTSAEFLYLMCKALERCATVAMTVRKSLAETSVSVLSASVHMIVPPVTSRAMIAALIRSLALSS